MPYQEIKQQNRTSPRTNMAENLPYLPWGVLALATGIGLYFSLSFEGSKLTSSLILLASLISWLFTQKNRQWHLIATFTLLTAVGYSAALYRTHAMQTALLPNHPVIYSFTMMVEDTVPIQSNRIRYSGQILKLSKLKKQHIPKRIRLQTTDQGPRFKYGDIICGKAVLSRPKGPVMPGGFDFGRSLWFKQIGGTGYSIRALRLCQGDTMERRAPLSNTIATIRSAIALRLQQNLDQRSLALAKALILGDRGRIEKRDLEAMRKAGLGHLLAISGLHMAVFAGTLFFVIRALLALSPTLAEQHPIKKWAAVAALAGGAVYFLISGQSIPTQRAFLMIAIIFLAMLLDRPALTLRNVVLAAIIILLLRPESLMSPGFQMSFAAVTALIVFYEWNMKLNLLGYMKENSSHASWLTPLYYLGGIWLTSLVATAATAPFAIYHFHQISYMGPIGNMLAIPIFSILIMPLAVASLCLMPFGLEAIPLYVLPKAIEIMLASAHWTASFEPALITIGMIEARAVILFSLAAILAIFASKPLNYLALPLLLISIWSASPTEKPDLYIDEKGKTMVLRDQDGKLYAPDGRKGHYIISQWLRADGDTRSPVDIRAGSNISCDDVACSGLVKGMKVTLLKTISALEEECKSADIIIYKHKITRNCKVPYLIVTKPELKDGGTHVVFITQNDQLKGEKPRKAKIRVKRAYEARNQRIWGQ